MRRAKQRGERTTESRKGQCTRCPIEQMLELPLEGRGEAPSCTAER